MKILELRFKNLNSLYGEWKIDFTQAEYISNGIFAITGPTGAGKSTLLDAICLALYGATPRLGKITKSANELMSQQTGECFAEVTFASQSGKFRCHWSQHKARKKADGVLAESKHEIADAVTGQILESKKRDVASVIEEKTGMNFERFTRSILLAQGGFAAFLTASTDERAPILEQITGTEIYSEISKRVHERRRVENEKLGRLTAETSGITILTDEQVAAFNLDLHEKQQQEEAISDKTRDLKKAIDWLTAINKLHHEISSTEQEHVSLNKKTLEFQPTREKLVRAQKAAALDGEYSTLITIRKQEKDARQALAIEELKLPETQSAVLLLEKQVILAEQHLADTKKEQKSMAPLIQTTRALDQQLFDIKKSITAKDEICKRIIQEINNQQKQLETITAQFSSAQCELDLVQHYLQENRQDELLCSQFTGIEEQLNQLLAIQKELADKKETLPAAQNLLELTSTALLTFTRALKTQKEQLNQLRAQIEFKKIAFSDLLGDKLLREYRAEKENLLREMLFLKKIASLEAERNKLENEKPCPLCGSTTHPYAENNIPEMNETEKKIEALSTLIKQAEQFEKNIQELEYTEKTVLQQVTMAEKQEANAANQKENAHTVLTDLNAQMVQINMRYAELKKSILNKLTPLDIQELPDSKVNNLRLSLHHRLQNWNKKQQQKQAYEKQIYEFSNTLKPLDAIIQEQSKSLHEKQDELQAQKLEYKIKQDDRIALFGVKNPDTEETRVEKVVVDAEENEKNVRIKKDKIKQSLDASTGRIAALNTQISSTHATLQILEADFIRSLNTSGFIDEPSFKACQLTTPERDLLSSMAKKLDDEKTNLIARKIDRESRLALEINKKITTSKLEDLEPALQAFEQKLKHLSDDIVGLKYTLTANQAAQEKIQKKKTLIDAQKLECNRLEKLHHLIGSSDGKKFRNFAQGLTFELMVSHANKQLEKMSDRYLLIRDDTQPLELNVVDNYQAGEIRTTKNLSGGESFIVSLSLALGLSKMASQKVRVDSLFLDEGFGTLDDEALETALETLSELQQDGKVIGIISHVLALKERISTQINVQPVSGGRSTITGPGCEPLRLSSPIEKMSSALEQVY